VFGLIGRTLFLKSSETAIIITSYYYTILSHLITSVLPLLRCPRDSVVDATYIIVQDAKMLVNCHSHSHSRGACRGRESS
jgi:hypothetical protein